MHVAIVTAGGAGMFCGSCMHDNTLARALHRVGCEVSLIPTYTPVRVDEENLSSRAVQLGGINMYLDHAVPLWNRLPRWMTRWLDSPRVISMATRFGVSNDAARLGPLTLDLLRGMDGPNRREIREFVDDLCLRLQPDLICFSNALLSGTIPYLRQRYDGPLVCLLQGDDIFLDGLPPPYREQAIELIRSNSRGFNRFLAHSEYYRNHMTRQLGLDGNRCGQMTLGIDLDGHDGMAEERNNSGFTVGYFARICPEKGLHHLVEAMALLKNRHAEVRLLAAGYLGKRDARWFRLLEQTASRQLGTAFRYCGSPATHADKVQFLKSIDILSVPTEYREPKGLYVLEALANGTPVVQPAHGAFPELIERTGGGLLIPPGDPVALADSLEQLLLDQERRLAFARNGQVAVRESFGLESLGHEAAVLFRNMIAAGPEGSDN